MNPSAVLVAVPTALLCFVAAVVVAAAGAGAGSSSPVCAASPAGTPAPSGPGTSALGPEQSAYAAVVITTGIRAGLPARAQIIALEAALQASRLHNIPTAHGGRQGVGLFRRRPSAQWGTASQLTDPEHAASAFYRALARIPHWPTLPMALAARSVQARSTTEAYARWEHTATTLVAGMGPAISRAVPGHRRQPLNSTDCSTDDGDGLSNDAGAALPAGFTLPPGTPASVATAIRWALAQRGTPYHYGGDCSAPRSGVAAHQCDCSSLIQMAYRAGHVTVPRTTTEQIRIGSPVHDLTGLLPGDLVFTAGSEGTTASPRHVGLYIGEGLIVVAPHTGENVQIQRESTWTSVAAVRRPIT